MPPIPCTVLDPFGGAGTTGLVADQLQRDAILIELHPEYMQMAERRITSDAPLFANVNYKKWNPDLINFDASRSYGTPRPSQRWIMASGSAVQ